MPPWESDKPYPLLFRMQLSKSNTSILGSKPRQQIAQIIFCLILLKNAQHFACLMCLIVIDIVASVIGFMRRTSLRCKNTLFNTLTHLIKED